MTMRDLIWYSLDMEYSEKWSLYNLGKRLEQDCGSGRDYIIGLILLEILRELRENSNN